MSSYITTFTKKRFNPITPEEQLIDIKDIAHALSLMTRANGHFKHFYSVGQHCINCYKEAREKGYSTEVQLGCLLHDASEAYISDITRPVKRHLPEYLIIEGQVQRVIYEKYNLDKLTIEDFKIIEEIDDTILHYEFKELMGVKIFELEPPIALKHDFSLKGFQEIEDEYLKIFYKLCN
ncbi:phosphohydrolase [Serpentinicella alkaliphila]|uniref:HD domain-containing protein n=1 Tax=Serpentinicella alkaliphila TaxID=1734049 RepID=A0A4R2TLA6_9FIRM|nr:phosphohydrolase [Serpentinicella alkaliphila]QUH26488.1 phosphohydrolase [Serpentinicella alkaliphila]TCQ03232.1 hypothetical protein EDD79_101020 [Serpentinicella alkaliphila]